VRVIEHCGAMNVVCNNAGVGASILAALGGPAETR
jgi:hypothetical protein